MRKIVLLVLVFIVSVNTLKSQTLKGGGLEYVTLYKLNDLTIEFYKPCIYLGKSKGIEEGKTKYVVLFEEYGIRRSGDSLQINSQIYNSVANGSNIKIFKDSIFINGKKMTGKLAEFRINETPKNYKCSGVEILFLEDADSFSSTYYNNDNATFSNGLLTVKIWDGKLVVWGEARQPLNKGDVFEISPHGIVKKGQRKKQKPKNKQSHK
ncbi:MAG: hypothetical protein ACSHX6_12460 [Akkermansiaceae bacterium]